MTKEFDERNMAKSRRVCEEMEKAHVTKWLKLTERERQILDMWPKFEDGEYVWFGDRVYELCGKVYGVCLDDDAISLRTAYMDHMPLDFGERVKRLEPEVLDADGVEIKVGDSMYVANNGDGPYIVCDIEESIDRIELFWHENRNERLFIPANRLTHARPDSWERLEEDASKDACMYFGTKYFNCGECLADGANCLGRMKSDLIRRAKALAGVEVD